MSSFRGLPGCLRGLQLQLGTVTGDPGHNLFHGPLLGGLKRRRPVKVSSMLWMTTWASFIQFKWLPAGFEIVLEAEKSPLPETQPRFSFWTFGHLSWPCGAPRWPPLSGGEAPATTRKCKSKPHYFYPSSLIINMLWKKNTHISVFAFIFKAVQTYGVLRHL